MRWVVALLTVLVAGPSLGWAARRHVEQGRVPPRPPRPAVVDAALRAWAEGDRPTLEARLAEAQRLAPGADRSVQGELRFLEAALAGDRRLLGTLAEEAGDLPAGARARWVLIELTRRPENRAAMHDAFARAYPDSWVLAGETGAGGS